MKETIVIIPAYNEEKTIGKVVKEIKENISEAAIVVINDGSSDNTASVSSKAGAKVINLPFNMGYGAALQTGFKYALENNYNYAVQIDGDGQHDPQYIIDLLKVVQQGKADLAIGSRFLENVGYKAPLIRRLGMIFFGSIASLIIKQKVTDPTSGFQALNQKVIKFYASDYYPVDFPDADVIIMLHRIGLKIKEAPVKMHPSKDSKKSMHSGLKPIYYIFKMLLSIMVTLLRKDYLK